jgi:hypothetical protein
MTSHGLRVRVGSKRRKVSLALGDSNEEDEGENGTEQAPIPVISVEQALVEAAAPAPPDDSKVSLLHKILVTDLWSYDSSVVKKGLVRLVNMCLLANNSEHNECSLVRRAGGQLAIVGALKRWYADPGIQSQGFMVLAICGLKSNRFWDSAREVGALELILTAMKNYPNDVAVLEAACAALQQAALFQENAKRIVTASNGEGVKSLVATMKKFQWSVDLQKYACGVLDRLGKWDELKVPVVEAGALVALATAIETHKAEGTNETKDIKDIQESARSALKRLA